MLEKRLDHNFFERVKIEHTELVGVMSQIRHILRTQSDDAHELDWLVTQMCNLVESHFLNEEQGGYLSEVVEQAPHLVERARQLFRQHEALLDKARELRPRVHKAVSPPISWTTIHQDFEEFAQALVTHEAHEDDLVQEAYLRDEPAGD